MPRIPFAVAVENAGIAAALTGYDWCLAGTPPLGIAVAGSDIDVLCDVADLDPFCVRLWRHFSHLDDFSMHQWTGVPRAIVASFSVAGWPFEIFADGKPLKEQAGWQHFDVERRLLALGGAGFRAAILEARETGLKTEPAFAAVLGLAGNPYQAMLDLFEKDDAELAAMISRIMQARQT